MPATSEKATHSPSGSDVLVTFTRRLSAVYVSTTSKENVTTSVLPALTSLIKKMLPSSWFRSPTKYVIPLTHAIGGGASARGVFAGMSLSNSPASSRANTDECGSPVARLHRSFAGTSPGMDVQTAVPVLDMLRAGSWR